MPIRLVDELSVARIETPLRGVGPWETVSAGLEERPFWQPRFHPGDSISKDCRATGESALHCEPAEGQRHSVAFRFRSKPHSHYRVAARLRSGKSRCAQARISGLNETRARRVPDQADQWQEFSELWQTGGRGDTVRIAFRGSCSSLSIESLQVTELVVGGAEELSALAAQAVSPFAGSGLGMAKFGSLLPHRDAETVAGPFDENWSLRESILAPAPTDITYALTVPTGGRLRFSYALSDMSRVGDRTRFEVLVGTRFGAARAVWAEELTLAPSNWHWHEALVDLHPFAGKEVELTLRTRTEGERGYALWGTPTIDRSRRRDEPPNIVLISVDTLRADRLSGYGYEKPTSPNLDALARDGALFLYPVSQSTQTPPSFASLFTGQIVARHGFLFAISSLAPNVPTLARVLRQNGWTTHGAMFHAALYDEDLARGFERYFNMPRARHRADQNLAKGLHWLATNGDRRFFFFLHFSDPHQPFTHPPEFVQEQTAASLAEQGVELPFNIRGSIGSCAPCKAEGGVPESFRRVVSDLYDEEINYVDDQIGVFLEELKKRDLYDDTIIAFVSDHGESLWDRFDYFGHGGFNQNDELTRVPLIIKPAKGRGYASGAVVETQVRSFDLMPTLLEMAGVDTSLLSIEAESLGPLMREDAGTVRREDRWGFSSNEQAASVRGRGWKWTWSVERGEALFDLAADPLEATDLTAQKPAILRGMRSRYMENLLETVGGRYLLLLDPADVDHYSVRVETPVAGYHRPLPVDAVGLRRSGVGDSETTIYRGSPLKGGLVLFARLPPSAELPVVQVTRERMKATTRIVGVQTLNFEPGAISRLLAEGTPGAYLIEAPLRSTAAADEETSQMGAEQEKALRALGYIQ